MLELEYVTKLSYVLSSVFELICEFHAHSRLANDLSTTTIKVLLSSE